VRKYKNGKKKGQHTGKPTWPSDSTLQKKYGTKSVKKTVMVAGIGSRRRCVTFKKSGEKGAKNPAFEEFTENSKAVES